MIQSRLDESTVTEVEDHGDAFVVYFVSNDYYRTRNILDLEVGAGPAICIKTTDEIFWTGSGQSADQYLEAYRNCGDVFGRLSEAIEITRFTADIDKKKAVLRLKAILGTGLSEVKEQIETMQRYGKIVVSMASDQEATNTVEKLAQAGFEARQLWRHSTDDGF